jgi:hypothetical protein
MQVPRPGVEPGLGLRTSQGHDLQKKPNNTSFFANGLCRR